MFESSYDWKDRPSNSAIWRVYYVVVIHPREFFRCGEVQPCIVEIPNRCRWRCPSPRRVTKLRVFNIRYHSLFLCKPGKQVAIKSEEALEVGENKTLVKYLTDMKAKRNIRLGCHRIQTICWHRRTETSAALLIRDPERGEAEHPFGYLRILLLHRAPVLAMLCGNHTKPVPAWTHTSGFSANGYIIIFCRPARR